MWDPDGAGPLAPRLVVGGTMQFAGATPVTYVAVYDEVARIWSPLGNPGWNVNALAITSNGDLVAAGDGSTVVRWNGVAWTPLGGSHNGLARALSVRANGDLVVGGRFTSIGGVAASNAAVWNGTAWSALGSGLSGGTGVASWLGVYSLAETTGGDLVVGGNFTLAGGGACNHIARWDGAAWSPLGIGISGSLGPYVRTLLALPGGDVVAGGSFDHAGGLVANNVALWNGSAWAAMGSLGSHVYSLCRLQSGAIAVGGSFTGALAFWSGSAWTPVSGIPGNPSVLTLTELPSGVLALGGGGVAPFVGLMLWDGSAAMAPNDGFAWVSGLGKLRTVAALPNGDFVFGGRFNGIAGVPAANVARWDGAAWHAFGAGTDNSVRAIAVLPNGDIVIGGEFATAGGVPASRIARWDGSTWLPLGAGTDDSVLSLCVRANGDLIAGGAFTTAGGIPAAGVARWDGTAWSPLGGGLVGGEVRAVIERPNGDLVAGGTLPGTGASATSLRRWDGTTWSTMATFESLTTPPFGIAGWITGLANTSNGDLLVCGGFELCNAFPARSIARWNGTAWSDIGVAPGINVDAVLELPGGDILAATFGLRRRHGGSWSDAGMPASWFGTSIAQSPAGELAVAGAGTSGVLIAAVLASNCPATASGYGLGCPSSGGANTLTATTLPWVDATFRAQADGLPALAAAFATTSFTSLPQGLLPLASVFAQAPSGCDLLVAPDIVQFHVATNGSLETSFFLPSAPPIVGMTFFHQVVPFELDALGNVVTITATNALQLTAGAL